MSHDADFLLALKLQEEFNRTEENEREEDDFDANEFRGRKRIRKELNATQNIVNPEWETIDPTPDIHSLFGAFDLKFFQGKLKCVELEWSKKMYQCAGICYQRRNRLGMSITIRLSEPLLKLRSRRNLIETLLVRISLHSYFLQF